jgi:hypothetical protein
MKSSSITANPEIRIPLAAFLAWLIPGAGHIFIGERVRGIIFMIAIALTFWTGVAIGGVKKTVDPVDRSLWYLGQISAGIHPLAVQAWSKHLEPAPDEDASELVAFVKAEDVSVVYTAICGMLNILVILDVIGRAAQQPTPDSALNRPPPKIKRPRK